MPIQTDLSVSPYFDDFREEKNFYKILFQPEVSVQARELNQLQTILQNQIERFGDNYAKKGTIISGCNITFYPRLPYIKIKDVETDGAPVNVSQYQNLYIRNSANLVALVQKTEAGLEASRPNLNTLFVQYQNSGNDYNTSSYSENEVLTVYDPTNPIFKILISDGSSSFANTDNVVITPAVAVQNSTGGNTFSITIEPNDFIRSAGVAVGQIVEVNSTARDDALVLRIKPTVDSLRVGNTALWSFYQNDTVEIYKNANPLVKTTANRLDTVYGFGAEASLVTDGLGKITSISMVNTGQGYDIEPYVSISSNSAVASEINQFTATAQRYLTNITVAGAIDSPVGFGYGMAVDEGVIYQKGYFSRVDEQLVIVEKYSNTGFDKSVGFYTNEEIINSSVDESLLDNATGTPNYTAPGADRLKLTPQLIVLDKAVADANSEFFTIVDFAQGSPYKQNGSTVYATIGDMIAQRTYEESGNYVLDPFTLTTKDSANTARAGSKFNIYIDPGLAYINGYRVKTSASYVAEIDKATSYISKPGAKIALDYGGYLRVNELGGNFNFVAGDIVELYAGGSTAVAVTFDNAGDHVSLAGHGLVAGQEVTFPTIVTLTDLTTNTKYYVVNTTTDTFQVAAVAGGTPIVFSNNGTGTMLVSGTNTSGAKYITTNAGSEITPVGTKIGQARVRSVVYEPGSGPVGTPEATYRMYIFDVTFNAGARAGDIRSVYYPGANKGIADVVLDGGVSQIYGQKNSKMLFKSINATKSLSNTIFTYRASLNTSVNQEGLAVITPGTNEEFPYTYGTFLSDVEESTITVTPTIEFQRSANASGGVSTTSGSPTVAGTSTQFLTAFSEGDFIKVYTGAGANTIGQIKSIANNTSLTLISAAGASVSGNAVQYFPKNVAIPLTLGTDRTARVPSSGPNTGKLEIDIGANISLASANVIIDYNITKTHEIKSKTPVREAHVRIKVSNSAVANAVAGPWPLGVADVFRLRNVYVANGAAVNTTFNAATSVSADADFIAIPSNPFSDGDQVTYLVAAGNTAIGGLANNTSYYVVESNTTGIKVSSTWGGAAANLAVGTSETGHAFSGSPLFFTPTTNLVTDVTNQYYIDNNQNPDYLDISYLYRKPGTGSAGQNDVLLVVFDAFQTTGEGVKTINSYTIDDNHALDAIVAGAVNTLEVPELFNAEGAYFDLRDQIDIRPVSTSTIPLITNTAAYANSQIINPVEPVDGVFANAQFNGQSAVSNTAETITLTSNPFVDGDAVLYYTAAGNTAIGGLANNTTYYVTQANSTSLQLLANPTDTTAVDLTSTATSQTGHYLQKAMLRFSEGIKYFPVPGTVSESDVDYYVGRTDRVVLTTDGRFRVIKGTVGKDDVIPPAPTDAMTINIVKIPPYPSLPKALNGDIAAIADTRVFNEKSNLRRETFRIATLLDANQQAAIQIKPYTMADIATLERRIKNLEYYVSVTLAETIARTRFIASSVPNGTGGYDDRFKFGFFVDAFASYNFADLTNPEFYATIVSDQLIPKVSEFNLEFTYDLNSDGIIGETLASFDYNEQTLVSQLDSTSAEGSVAISPELDTVEVRTVTQEIVSSTGAYRSSARNDNKTVYEDWSYTFSSLAGPAKLFVNATDQKVQIEVYQSTVPGDTTGNPVITSTSFQKLTNADKAVGGGAYDLGSALGYGRNTKAAARHESDGFSSHYPWVEDSFKMLWNHNPANGQYYTIRVFKGAHSGGLFGGNSPKGFYVFRLYYPSDKVTVSTRTIPPRGKFEYQGSVYQVSPQTFTFTQSTQSIDLGYLYGGSIDVPNGYLADAQRFDITVTGLRPDTLHSFYFDEQDVTGKCTQVRNTPTTGTVPNGLVSDANGVLTLSFYYDAGINEAAESDFTKQNQLAAQLAGIKTFSLTNIDGSSFASGSIELKYYAGQINTMSVPVLEPISIPSATITATTTATATPTTSVTESVIPSTGYDYTGGTLSDTNPSIVAGSPAILGLKNQDLGRVWLK